MLDESVKRQGRWLTVQRGAVSVTRAYSTAEAAKRKEKRLLFERAEKTALLERRGG